MLSRLGSAKLSARGGLVLLRGRAAPCEVTRRTLSRCGGAKSSARGGLVWLRGRAVAKEGLREDATGAGERLPLEGTREDGWGVEDRLATKEECREHETGVGGRVPLYRPTPPKEVAEGKRKKLRPVSPRGNRSLECWCAAKWRSSRGEGERPCLRSRPGPRGSVRISPRECGSRAPLKMVERRPLTLGTFLGDTATSQRRKPQTIARTGAMVRAA